MRHSFSNALRVVSAALLLLMSLSNGCDNSLTPDPPPSIHITQPVDSAVVSDTVVRILTEVMVKCGCNTHVEFHIDGVHLYSDYFPFYSFDWNTTGYDSGWHSIAARVVVTDVGEAWDSIYVYIPGADSLRSNLSLHY